jgi:diketogulonate reductase-like aldo/keto reductase
MEKIPEVTLNNSISMPQIGLGTWHMADDGEAERAVAQALKAGYRLIDTAKYYGNEHSVGKAVRLAAQAGESKVPREEIFVTTKLWPTDFFNPRKAFEKSLERLGFDYVDLYLIHWPTPAQPKSIWRTLEKVYEEKLVRSIGVSNYGIGDIEKLLAYAHVPPAVNQIKFSPFDFAEEILNVCRKSGIIVEAYSPLTRGYNLDDPTIAAIARKHDKSSAQIMIRWCIEHGTVPIPKSTHPDRMRENIDVFDFTLDEEDMERLDALS